MTTGTGELLVSTPGNRRSSGANTVPSGRMDGRHSTRTVTGPSDFSNRPTFVANSGWSGPAGVVPGAQLRAWRGVGWVIQRGRIGRVRQVHTGRKPRAGTARQWSGRRRATGGAGHDAGRKAATGIPVLMMPRPWGVDRMVHAPRGRISGKKVRTAARGRPWRAGGCGVIRWSVLRVLALNIAARPKVCPTRPLWSEQRQLWKPECVPWWSYREWRHDSACALKRLVRRACTVL